MELQTTLKGVLTNGEISLHCDKDGAWFGKPIEMGEGCRFGVCPVSISPSNFNERKKQLCNIQTLISNFYEIENSTKKQVGIIYNR